MSRRDYSSKKSHAYQTPRTSIHKGKVKREVIKRRIRIIGLILLSIMMIGGIVYVFFFSSLFTLHTIIVRDIEQENKTHEQLYRITQGMLEEKILGIFPGKNYFLFSKKTLLQRIKENKITPPVEEVYVSKKLSHTLILAFKRRIGIVRVIRMERISYTKPQEGGEVVNNEIAVPQIEYKEEKREEYIVDAYGIVVDKISSFTDTSIRSELPVEVPSIRYFTRRSFEKDDAIVGESIVQQILNLYATFKGTTAFRRLLNFPDGREKVNFFELREDFLNDIIVMMSNKYRIHFSLLHPLQNQINNLVLTLEKVGEENYGKLEYIDLRVEGRVYACCNLAI